MKYNKLHWLIIFSSKDMAITSRNHLYTLQSSPILDIECQP
ncbi:hypothetical protein [Pseudomonas fragi]|nr:hypothetical protein [Pseudomonas fragi]